jgi:hypothetical protein
VTSLAKYRETLTPSVWARRRTLSATVLGT